MSGFLTFSPGGELHVSPLHLEEIIRARVLLVLLHHRVPMRELPAEDVAEDLSVAVGMCREASVGCDAVFVEDAERPKGFELGRII